MIKRLLPLLVLLVAACEGCAIRSMSTTDAIPPIPFNTGKGYLARTGCDPATERTRTEYEDGYGAGTRMYGEVRAHEEMHVSQVKRFGCAVWMMLYKHDEAFRVRSEAEAMCAAVPIAMAEYGLTREAAVDRYAGWMWGAYNQQLQTFMNARALVLEFCKEPT